MMLDVGNRARKNQRIPKDIGLYFLTFEVQIASVKIDAMTMRLAKNLKLQMSLSVVQVCFHIQPQWQNEASEIVAKN